MTRTPSASTVTRSLTCMAFWRRTFCPTPARRGGCAAWASASASQRSRLSANIPFIKRNLSPLSFIDVPRALYMDAILGVYELNKIDLLRDVFIWAYERSAARYAAVRQSLGEPDPFRFKHKAALRQIVGEVVRGLMDREAAE